MDGEQVRRIRAEVDTNCPINVIHDTLTQVTNGEQYGLRLPTSIAARKVTYILRLQLLLNKQEWMENR